MKRIVLLFCLITVSAYAQQPSPDDDPIGKQLFPPDLIMSQSQKLHLDEKQRTTIRNEVTRAQSKFFDLQWQAKEAGETMAELLQQTHPDRSLGDKLELIHCSNVGDRLVCIGS